MQNFILKNITTGVKENLSYSELMARLNKNRKEFFNTYRIETVNKKSIIEKLLFTVFVGVSSLAMGVIILETITQIF
jgi:macrodomain Ter protein organizer (MatP/YcbG family)